MQGVSLKLPEDLLEELDRISSELGLPRSEVIRRAIIEWVNRYKEVGSGVVKPKIRDTIKITVPG